MVILQVGFCYALHVGAVVWAAVVAAVAVQLGGWHHAWDPQADAHELDVRSVLHSSPSDRTYVPLVRTRVPWYQ